jgi:type IV pilus assembly protein PilB
MLTILKKQIDRPNGIILVTGPTGSGKTTTLYSALRCMDGSRMNISTVEDPVEYHLSFANQIQVQERIGMTFSAALRALLRQDPDVIMLGEVRDAETAHIAVQASLTGHLVLSTLHTNDAPSSITRLINIGVEAYLISAAVNAVLAQRLVRRICSKCKAPFVTEDEEMQDFLTTHGFDPTKIYKGKGCDFCRNTGYKGRVGIYELLILDDVARDLVVRSPNVTELRRMCRERGMLSLREDGLQKVALGQTTVEEVLAATENTM